MPLMHQLYMTHRQTPKPKNILDRGTYKLRRWGRRERVRRRYLGKTKKRGLTQKALALASNQSEPRRFHQKREVWRELNLISLNRLIEEGLPDSFFLWFLLKRKFRSVAYHQETLENLKAAIKSTKKGIMAQAKTQRNRKIGAVGLTTIEVHIIGLTILTSFLAGSQGHLDFLVQKISDLYRLKGKCAEYIEK
ncbi:uncharacterized protein LOC114277482 [Camellia sinensis]|uniref:uncharacterized protein LOC114277482 n=1 Tax=Camellia sinensis TaxID=4442 RepID=UPI00103611CC|nr:uncharacterized protein LOC114277482 [Camellia sinensis]